MQLPSSSICNDTAQMVFFPISVMMENEMPKAMDLTGYRFGRLTVVAFGGHRGRNRIWECICDCGKECKPSAANLMSGNSTACGNCRAINSGSFPQVHGDAVTRTPTYQSWTAMRQRVLGHSKDKGRIRTYGGLSIDPSWDDYGVFRFDMGERPAGMTLDRKDNSLGYSKENCRWATPVEQTRNRTITKRYTIDGVTKTTMEWALEAGISFGAAQHRLRTYGNLSVRRRPSHATAVR